MAGEEPVLALPSGLMFPGCARLAVLHSRIWLKAEASGSWMEGAWSIAALTLRKPHSPRLSFAFDEEYISIYMYISQMKCLC